jgi:hypothetical protein
MEPNLVSKLGIEVLEFDWAKAKIVRVQELEELGSNPHPKNHQKESLKT